MIKVIILIILSSKYIPLSFSDSYLNFDISKCPLWYPQLLQKKYQKIRPNNYDASGRIFFVRFLEELKTPKRRFEINWPLA